MSVYIVHNQLRRHQPLVDMLARSKYFPICVVHALFHTRVFFKFKMSCTVATTEQRILRMISLSSKLNILLFKYYEYFEYKLCSLNSESICPTAYHFSEYNWNINKRLACKLVSLVSAQGSNTLQNPVRDFKITQKSIDFSDFIDITDFIDL